MTGKLVKTQRTLDCGTCTGCTTTADCGKCKMCLDKPKFGGPGKQKQRCIMRKCQNHPTKPPMKISTNKSLSLEAQLQINTCMSSKLYKCFVYKTDETFASLYQQLVQLTVQDTVRKKLSQCLHESR